jgi:outer membrane protein TolC
MDSGTRGAVKGSNARLAALEAEARHARERYQLYRAKAYGPRLTSAGRLRALERTSKLADSRLDRARAEVLMPGLGD